MNSLNLKISGMHCGACVRRVNAALEKVPGVRVGAVDVGSARLEYDPARSDTQAIKSALEKIGFEVESVQE